MKWQDIKDVFEDLRRRPFRTLLLLVLLLSCAYLIALATAAGKAAGEGGFSWPSLSRAANCEDLYTNDLEKWIELCNE